MDVEQRNEIIAKIAEKERLKEKIQSTIDTIRDLDNEVKKAIYDYVCDVEDIDTAVAICTEFGIPANRRWMEKAHSNSNQNCPNHDEAEWYDVISGIEFDIKTVLDKHAEKGFRYKQ